MIEYVYLNGDFIAKSKAKISVLDRGFLFGDGIYEVIPVYQQQPFRLQEHLTRLKLCLEQVSITNPYSDSQWQQLISQLIDKNQLNNTSIYIQVTRGIDMVRSHVGTAKIEPSVLIMTSPLALDVADLNPIKAVLLDDNRWQHCNIKSIALLGNVLLKQQAFILGFDEAILHREQQVTEGASSNVFMVKNKELYTPEKSQWILGGITRDLIIELAENASIKVHQCPITIERLFNADEVWLSSSSREISPVCQINDKIINQGDIGPIAKQIHSAFQEFKQALTH